MSIGIAALLAAGCSGQSAAAPASNSSNSRPGAVRWIVNESAIGRLGDAGMNQAKLRRLFGTPDTFLAGGPTNAEKKWQSVPTQIFTSYKALQTALANHTLNKGVKAVLYDNEHWTATPIAEQKNPGLYEELAARAAHAHHLMLVSTPAVDLTAVLAPGNNGSYAAYLKLGLAAQAARYADAIDIQAQGSEADLPKFSAFVKAATAQARKANRHVAVLAGLSTNPSGQKVTPAQFTAAFNAVRGTVDGYWLNIPAGGSACPACGTPHPEVAIPLLNSLAR